tara:strand:- start:716 stop:1318 length:603 start_codon:yes stop_codon:yes gene_type:complete
MICQKCNNSLAEEAKFCGICGLAVEKPNSESIISEETSPQIESDSLPMVSFQEAIKKGFNNYFVFRGRSTRAEFWWWQLFYIVVSIILSIIDSFTGIPNVLQSIFGLVLLIPSISLATRRLHDINKSGWCQLLWFVPVGIGAIIALVSWIGDLHDWAFYGTAIAILIVFTLIVFVLLIYWYVRQGDDGSNKYGQDPRKAY